MHLLDGVVGGGKDGVHLGGHQGVHRRADLVGVGARLLLHGDALGGQVGHIPILFSAVSDPIKDGIVADLNAPGGKATGTSDALVPVFSSTAMPLADR